LLLEKLVNEKHFSLKEKFGLVFRKVFSFYFGRKTVFRSCEKFKNIMLFADYINLVIKLLIAMYFILNQFFNFIPYNLIFISTLAYIFMVVICFFFIIFLIRIFNLSDLVIILLIVIYFI